MKFRYILSSIALLSLAFFSCNKEVNEPATDCAFMLTTDNDTHPLSATYQALLDEYCERGLPGISLVVESAADGLWAGSAGMARIEDQVAMEPCHVHHSASIAKTYISTLVLRLAEDGLLDLEDPAKNYLPVEISREIANADVATIRQLLNHTSGIYNFDSNMKVYVDTFNDPLVNPSSQVLFEKYVYGMPAYFPVGEGFHYSNTNYSLLGMIIEQASGMSLGDYMNQEIIEALNLESTYFKSSAAYPEVPNIVNNYFEHFPTQIQNCTEIQKHFSDLAMGHEGVIATPYDFARFMKELYTGNVLGTEYTALVRNTGSTQDEFYGLGIKEYKTDYESGFGHTGGSIGTMTYAIYFPGSDISFSVCCNLGAVFASENTSMFYEDLFDELMSVIFTGERL